MLSLLPPSTLKCILYALTKGICESQPLPIIFDSFSVNLGGLFFVVLRNIFWCKIHHWKWKSIYFWVSLRDLEEHIFQELCFAHHQSQANLLSSNQYYSNAEFTYRYVNALFRALTTANASYATTRQQAAEVTNKWVQFILK